MSIDLEQTPIGEFHRHEVLHTASIIQAMFEEHIEQHRYTQSEPELSAAAAAINDALADFYQLVGRKALD